MKSSVNKKSSTTENDSADIYSAFGHSNSEKLKKKKEDIDNKGRVPLVKFAPNQTTKIKLLPPHKGVDEFYLDTNLHWSMGSDGKSVRTCRKVYGHECKFCNLVDRMKETIKNAKDIKEIDAKLYDAYLERIRKISSSRRIISYGIDMANMDKGVQQIPIPVNVLSDVLDFIQDKYDGEDVFSKPKNGRILLIKRKGSKQTDTKYRADIGEKYTVPEEYLKQLLNLPPLKLKEDDESEDETLVSETEDANRDILELEKYLKVKKTGSKTSFKKAIDEDDEEEDDEEDDKNDISIDDMSRSELKAYIKELGLNIKVFPSMKDDAIRKEIKDLLDDDKEEEEEEEEEEIKPTKSSKSKKKVEEDDEEDEEEEEDDDDDDEEEEDDDDEVKPTKSKSKKKIEEEEDDDEEDDDEEDDDEEDDDEEVEEEEEDEQDDDEEDDDEEVEEEEEEEEKLDKSKLKNNKKK